jgi:hypothetical protein
MRSFQVFARMTPDQATAMMRGLNEKVPAMFTQAVHAAAAALKSRPVFLLKQPFEKRAAAVRRTLARVAANDVASEILAVYFLECRRDLLIEWLDLLGIEHEDGTLAEDEPASPDDAKLEEAISAFRAAGDDPDRELLMQAFAAQEAIEWSTLDARLETK